MLLLLILILWNGKQILEPNLKYLQLNTLKQPLTRYYQMNFKAPLRELNGSLSVFQFLGQRTHRFALCPAGLAIALPVQNVCCCTAVLSYQANSSVHCRFYRAPNSPGGDWHPAGQPCRIPGPVASCARAQGAFLNPRRTQSSMCALLWFRAFFLLLSYYCS